MAGIFGGDVAWIPGVGDFKTDYVLKGDLDAAVFQEERGDVSYVLLGDAGGLGHVSKSKTFEWGVNSIQPDGIVANGFMRLPERWGLNGQYLGITAGKVDWMTPGDISNLSVSIAQLACSAVTNQDVLINYLPSIPTGSTINQHLDSHYNAYRYSGLTTFSESIVWSGVAGSEVRLSTSAGLFSHAHAVSSMALGWQNTTYLPYSTLIGSNLDLSGHPYAYGQTDFSYGEVVIGTSNLLAERRPHGSLQRVLTIGCGDISDNSGNGIHRDDALYILKDGTTNFTKNIDISGKINVTSGIECSEGNLIINGTEANIFNQDLEIGQVNTGGGVTAALKLTAAGTVRAHSHIVCDGILKANTFQSLGNDMSLSALTNTINANQTLYIHDFDKMRFYNGAIHPTDTQITQKGISSEDISCVRITIGGLHFPPKINTTRDISINQLGEEWVASAAGGYWSANSANTGFVLASNGRGDVEWRDLSSVAQEISFGQLNNIQEIYRENLYEYLYICPDLDDVSGIKVNNLWGECYDRDNAKAAFDNRINGKDILRNYITWVK